MARGIQLPNHQPHPNPRRTLRKITPQPFSFFLAMTFLRTLGLSFQRWSHGRLLLCLGAAAVFAAGSACTGVLEATWRRGGVVTAEDSPAGSPSGGNTAEPGATPTSSGLSASILCRYFSELMVIPLYRTAYFRPIANFALTASASMFSEEHRSTCGLPKLKKPAQSPLMSCLAVRQPENRTEQTYASTQNKFLGTAGR